MEGFAFHCRNAQELQRCFAVAGLLAVVAVIAQQLCGKGQAGSVVINNQDLRYFALCPEFFGMLMEEVLLIRFFEAQGEPENRTLAFCTLKADFSTHQGDQLFGDR